MGRRCCVPGCGSTSRLPEHHGVTYHTIPPDPAIRQIWLRNCHLSADKAITKSVLVCSTHFRRSDFQQQRSGKYLLKQRMCPTVFPWGKLDPAQVEAELNELRATIAPATPTADASLTEADVSLNTSATTSSKKANHDDDEDTTKATVEAKVAQIMAEAAVLNASTGNQADGTADKSLDGAGAPKFEPVTAFNPGARLEAQDFNGVWHTARIAEVDNDDREVLIRFERSSSKTKATPTNTEEWIPMNSSRLRQRIPKNVPVFEVDEKCMARWSGPRKFPGTVTKCLGNDTYEILFDDGYVKNVRAVHMNKIKERPAATVLAVSGDLAVSEASSPLPLAAVPMATPISSSSMVRKDVGVAKPSSGKAARKRLEERKDWKLLDISKLDLASLNLPEIPRDGEWTCHWVNDQPIGREGFLVVGEHRKPTVIVDDWRLPPGWVKHMYQRSNVLGKWDVILVSPTNKRFRSKSDLKTYLEENNERYNPDVYDFSIHRRRAKDINAYAFTPDYTPQVPKSKASLDLSLSLPPETHAPLPATVTSTPTMSHAANSSLLSKSSEYMETPVATPVPPMELLTSPTPKSDTSQSMLLDTPVVGVSLESSLPPLEDGYAYIGGLKVQIIDNLFRCPQEGCLKNFRKENLLKIHVKHYHQGLKKLVGQCPKMMELAEQRTHPTKPEADNTTRSQMSNQDFFAKLHQQDAHQGRTNRKVLPQGPVVSPKLPPVNPFASDSPTAVAASKDSISPLKRPAPGELVSSVAVVKMEDSIDASNLSNADLSMNSTLDQSQASLVGGESGPGTPLTAGQVQLAPLSKRARFSPSKRVAGSRKSNRQRTTKRYLTAMPATTPLLTGDGLSDFDDQSRQSMNATPEVKVEPKRRKVAGSAMALSAPETPLSSVDSPITIDSRSSPLQGPSSSETDGTSSKQLQPPQQYIKENGEVIKIVRMRQEEIINCLCGYGEEDGLMIQCELCLCWQHGFCNGVDKEADVPENYVCYKCRYPERGRSSTKYKYEQEWLYDGKLPVANYHGSNPANGKNFQLMQKSHMLCGNLCELRKFLHSLSVKLSIASNRSHPKLYLWAHKWDDDSMRVKIEQELAEMGVESELKGSMTQPVKEEPDTKEADMPNVPQPEAPIDPAECQQRLLEHIKIQQDLATVMLNKIEKQVDELENEDDLGDFKDQDLGPVKEALSAFMKDLEIVKHIAKVNREAHVHTAMESAI